MPAVAELGPLDLKQYGHTNASILSLDSAIGWGVGLGAKLFDLLVLRERGLPASVLGAPTLRATPMNSGDFFQPLSIVMAVSVVAASHLRMEGAA